MKMLLALIPVAGALLTGCPMACGFEGEGDRTFRRGNDSMILCENGGFVMGLDSGYVEGRYSFDGVATVATRTNTTDVAFKLTVHGDGSATAPELGMLAWEQVQLDQVDLDHAHLQCLDLEARDWWTAQ